VFFVSLPEGNRLLQFCIQPLHFTNASLFDTLFHPSSFPLRVSEDPLAADLRNLSKH
jgi:hypothetical protein